jgi:hypothetical protein
MTLLQMACAIPQNEAYVPPAGKPEEPDPMAIPPALRRGKLETPSREYAASIAVCKTFTVSQFHDGAYESHEGLSLEAARAKGEEMIKANPARGYLVYGITDDGRSILVPRTYNPNEEVPVAKPKKKKAPAAGRVNKSEIAHKLLTRAKGATREELTQATGWPHVNLKVLEQRAQKTSADVKLVEDSETGRFRLV